MTQKVPAAALADSRAASFFGASERVRAGLQGRRGRAVIAGILVLVFATHWAVIVARRDAHPGDFDISREIGRRFLAGEPLYAGGLHYPYLPAAAAAFAPLALGSPAIAFSVRYAVALGCLWLTLHLLKNICRAVFPSVAADPLPIAAITLFLASHYVLRDLDDAGPHLILLGVLVVGVAAVSRGWVIGGAACFGLAAALKLPCALLIPFFLWSGRWRLARTTTIALAVWIALPLPWMGPHSWASHHFEWAQTALASAVGSPSAGAAESELRPQNQAWRPLVLRLGGSTTTANLSALALLAVVAVSMEPRAARLFLRRRERTLSGSWLADASAVLILSLLLSPITWVQHLVLMLPALYVLVVSAQASRPLRTGVRIAVGVYALLALGLNREVVGRTLYLELLSDGLHTICMLLVLAMVVWWRPSPTAVD